MISIGIDGGSQNTKGVLLKDGEICEKFRKPTEFDLNQAAVDVLEMLLERTGVSRDEVDEIVATGASREILSWSTRTVNGIISAAVGSRFVRPETDFVLDIGAESCAAIRLKPDGSVMQYEKNDKCASGAGVFIETMARALQIGVDEIGDYSLRHTKDLVTTAQCVVFAESEVISLIHRQETVEDIAYGIHMGIVNRIAALTNRVGLTEHVTLIGGPGHNKGLVKCMSDTYKRDIFVPEDTDYVSAIGAAVSGMQMH